MYINSNEILRIKSHIGRTDFIDLSYWDKKNLFEEIKIIKEDNLFLVECEYNLNIYIRRMNGGAKAVFDTEGYIRGISVKDTDFLIIYYLFERLEQIEPESFPYSLKEEKEKERRRKEEEERIRRENRFAESGSLIYNRFLNRYIEDNSFKQKEEIENKKYRLVLIFDGSFFQFKIGNDKLYIVKDLSLLKFNFNNKNIVQYGKSLKLCHNLERFDKQSEMLFSFIKQYLSGRVGDLKYIYLSDAASFIDDLIENYEFLKDNLTFKVIESDERIKLHLTKNERYLKIEFTLNGGNNFFVSDNNIYFTEENNIYYLKHTNEILNELIKNRIENSCVYIANTDIDRFHKYIYVNIEELVDSEGYDFNDLGETDYGITIKGDVTSDDEVGFEVIAHYESGNFNILSLNDKATSENLDIVKSVFENYSYKTSEDKYLFRINNEDTITFINDYLPYLTDKAEILITEQLKRLGSKKKYNIKVGVGVSNGLLNINVDTNDFDINEIGRILESYHKKKKYYKLKNGEIISLNSDELKELDEFVADYHLDTADFENGSISTNLYRSLAVDNSIEDFENVEIERKESFKEYLNNLKNSYDLPAIKNELKDVLRSYQLEGVNWMYKLNKYNFGGILADDMGLGKTLEVLTLLASERNGTSIVICPSSLILNWQCECEKFTPDLKCMPIYGNAKTRAEAINNYKDYDLLITSYDYLRRDEDAYKAIEFEYVILDEAQYIKNQATKNARACKNLNSKHRLALTGTPIENSLAELWSIFDFLMKGYLYPYNYFKEQFENDIVKNKDEDKSKRLKKLVEPFVLRRTKKEVLKDLPEKIEQTISFEFNDDEFKIYKANEATVAKNLSKEIKNQNVDRIAILAMLTRLRQLCLDRRLVYEDINEISSKLEGTMELLLSLKENNKKTLLFSAFTSALDLIENECLRNDIKYLKLTGSTNKIERKRLVEAFQNSEADVFLISLKAGGTGLNLTKAEAVIHFDPWWNMSAQNQATDRAYRIGQRNVLNVYKLIMKDSIEEKILKLQESKKELADLFIEGNTGSISSMSIDDIMDLFN